LIASAVLIVSIGQIPFLPVVPKTLDANAHNA
jgi:hypothetical protein